MFFHGTVASISKCGITNKHLIVCEITALMYECMEIFGNCWSSSDYTCSSLEMLNKNVAHVYGNVQFSLNRTRAPMEMYLEW